MYWFLFEDKYFGIIEKRENIFAANKKIVIFARNIYVNNEKKRNVDENLNSKK